MGNKTEKIMKDTDTDSWQRDCNLLSNQTFTKVRAPIAGSRKMSEKPGKHLIQPGRIC